MRNYNRYMSRLAALACAALAICTFLSCTATHRQPAQIQTAGTAIVTLQKAINEGHCEQFPRLTVQKGRGWQEHCEYIRETWGAWQSHSVTRWWMQNAQVLVSGGTIRFEKGECKFEFLWILAEGRVELAYVYFDRNDETIRAPELGYPRMDPPPPPTPAQSLRATAAPSPAPPAALSPA